MPRSAAPSSVRYSLRLATLRDLDLLVAHRLGMWREIRDYPAAVLRAHARDYRAWIRPRMRGGELIGLIAETQGRVPVASGCVWFETGQPRPGLGLKESPYILSMFTEPGHRGRSLATRIVRKMLAIARARGCSRIELHAAPLGRGVYSRLGFERTWEMRLWLNPRAARAWARRPPRPRRRTRRR